jgi:multiple sugar transport system substrate-binding protein
MDFTRRDLMKTTAGLAAGAMGGSLLGSSAFAQGGPKLAIEEGATLRLLRWSPFVKGDEDQWLANTQKFTEATGVQVRVDKESWEDIRPKAAVAANVGSGPDLMLVWFDDPHQYPDKLLDVTELANDLGGKYGGWYEGPKSYAMREGKFVGLPLATIGNAIVYRDSWVKEAALPSFRKTPQGFSSSARHCRPRSPGRLHARPRRRRRQQLTRIGCCGATAARWSTRAARWRSTARDAEGHRIRDGALQDLHSRHGSWLGRQQQPRLPGRRTLVIANGISAYYTAKTNKDNDPKLAEIAKDIRTTNLPIGRWANPVELHQVTTAVIFDYTPYPNAAKAYLQFMFESRR